MQKQFTDIHRSPGHSSSDSSKGKSTKIQNLKQAIATKEKEIAALLQEHTKKQLAFGQQILDKLADNEALCNDLSLSAQVINSLNAQVDNLLDWNWDIEIRQIKKPRIQWSTNETPR
jgi:hypothetical protein